LRIRNISDDHILLFLAEQHACDSRNSMNAGRIVNGKDRTGWSNSKETNVLPLDIEVDYSGTECTQESVLRAISGRHYPNTPSHRRLPDSMGPSSTLLVYLTGHGGNGFLKFHDFEEMSYPELAASLFDARASGRFGRALVIADTCQAESIGFGFGIGIGVSQNGKREEEELLWTTQLIEIPLFVNSIFSEVESQPEGGLFHIPGAVILSSSVTGQNSYAIQHDDDLGLSPADGLTHELYKILLNDVTKGNSRTRRLSHTTTSLKDLLELSPKISSTVNINEKAHIPLFIKEDSNKNAALDIPLSSYFNFKGKVALME